MILWINGAFGVGKTTTASLVRERERTWRLFDPEWVGSMLRANLGELGFDDFQDLVPWRFLVPVVASEIASLTGDPLLAVQTVLVETYWAELRGGLAKRNLDVFHVVLDADVTEALPRACHVELDWGHVPQVERPRQTHEAVAKSLEEIATVSSLCD